LQEIVLDPPDPANKADPWRKAYYCAKEDVFWVWDAPDGGRAVWYGPFPGKPSPP